MDNHTDVNHTEILTSLFGSKPESLEPINTGLSGAKLYKARYATQSYILRASSIELINSLTILIKDEYQMLQYLSESNVAPKLYYANPKNGVLIMAAIEAKPYNFIDDKILDKFTQKLKKLHSLSSNNNLITNCSLSDYLAYADNIVNSISNKQELPDYISKLRSCINLVEDKLGANWLLQLCHLDLNPTNIMYDGNEFYLVDWDSLRKSDPMLDLVGFMNFFCHDPSLAQKFLESYYGAENISSYMTKRIFFLSQINLYFYGIMFLNLAARNNEQALINVAVDDLSTSLDFYKRLSAGLENLSDSKSQARLGLCMLKHAYNKLNLEIKIHGISGL